MVTIRPVTRALIPVDSAAAREISAPNYDEFQNDDEIRELIAARPRSVLRVTMAHADDDHAPGSLIEGSRDALAWSSANMTELSASPFTRVVEEVLWVYEITGPDRPGVRQIGLGGMGLTSEIRTGVTPGGSIIRNEGVRDLKARGRADLVEATGAIIGTVNNAVSDSSGALDGALRQLADSRGPDLEVTAEDGRTHRVWLVGDPWQQAELQALLAAEPVAYVADGNHRSAAAAMLGLEEFLTVFFPTGTMGIQPYNRLISAEVPAPADIPAALEGAFRVTRREGHTPFQPTRTHHIGLYADRVWYELEPRAGTWDPANAVESIDADIVQRHIFAEVLGIPDATDRRLRFVGSNRDAAYMAAEVDSGRCSMAVTLPAVTMDEFVEVCRQNRLMPPKSTWFDPKIRSGLVMALLG